MKDTINKESSEAPGVFLHSFWSIEDECLVIWGEDKSRLNNMPESKKGRNILHPFSATPGTLLSLLEKILPDVIIKANTGSHTITLPVKQNIPFSSHENIPDNVEWREVTVPSLMLNPVDIHTLFGKINPDSYVPDKSTLEYWRLAYFFIINLCSAGLIFPKITYNYPEKTMVGWKALIIGNDIRNYYELLKRSAPIAALPSGKSAEDTLDSFFGAVIAGTLGESLGKNSGLNRKEKKIDNKTSPEKQFIECLRGERSQFTSDEYKTGNFARRAENLLSLTEIDKFFLKTDSEQTISEKYTPLIRLSCNPEDIYADWLVSYGFLTGNSPGDIINPDEIFNNPELNHYSKAELFSLINRASELYLKLKKSLQTMYCEPLVISSDDAFDFLLNYAGLFEEENFTVEVPSWWKSPAKKPLMKISAEPYEDTLFSANSLAGFRWEAAIGSTKISAEEFEELVRQKIPVIKYQGNWIRLDIENIEKQINYLKKRHPENILSSAGLLRLEAETDIEIEAKGRFGDMLAVIREPGKIPDAKVPQTFKGTLRPYQERGMCWLSYMLEFGFGVCLADDMGLGKTIQLIAYLALSPEKTKQTLIIAPMSVLGNWKREITVFLPEEDVYIHHGTSREKSDDFKKAIKNHRIILTTYHLVQRDEEFISAIDWDLVVLDEAQNIKNHRTKQSKAVRKLKSEKRLALTGTPVENRLLELWSIMDFLNPGYLGSYAEYKLTFGESGLKEGSAEKLRRLIRPFMLRRLKTDKTVIADLPDKMEMKVYCPLSGEQAALYTAAVSEMLGEIEESGGIERKGRVLSALTKLKQICNHPALFLKEDRLKKGRSGKLDRLTEMLEEVCANNEKALIFTQYATFADMLGDYLKTSAGVPVYIIHGKIRRKKREQMVELFQKTPGPGIFILSLKAGGTGLNLTAASHVFHIDRWWNPAVESQATDRAFRIGQDKNVQVHLMVASGTLEEKIDQMIERKKDLADKVLTPGDNWLTTLSNDEIREILSLSIAGDELI